METRLTYSIFLISLALHALLMLWLLSGDSKPKHLKMNESLVVKTIALKSIPDSVVEKKREVAAMAAPIEKKKSQKKVEKKRPPPPKESPQKKQNARKQAKDAIAKLLNAKNQPHSAAALGDLAVIDSLSSNESPPSSYYNCLAAQLKSGLILPEMGSVKLSLTINRNGHLIRIKTVSTESEYNKKFVQAALEKMQFPPFGQEFEGENAHTFLVTFENATCIPN